MSDTARPQPDVAMAPLGAVGKARLLARIWATALGVSIGIQRERLPNLVARLSKDGSRTRMPVGLLTRAVSRGLRIGPWQPRCLVRALVLYRLLRAQGEEAVLVIGLAEQRPSHEAHAWVELDGRDVGPAPGAYGHRALARYPLDPNGRGDAG
jgi:hypothetical protein